MPANATRLLCRTIANSERRRSARIAAIEHLAHGCLRPLPCHASWTFVTPGERGATIAQAGRYDDTLVRENGAWKFKRRAAANDTAPPGK